MKLVFDIETVGFDFESLSESQQEFLLRYPEKEKDPDLRQEKIHDTIRYLSLYPFTASVVCIGLYNIDTGKTLVMYEGAETEEKEVSRKRIKYKSSNERDMIGSFWEYVKKATLLISFNGRQFDLPFLMLRSAVLKIKPSRNFLKNKFGTNDHIDLLDKFTLMGLIKKFNLDFYCRTFGIESPKSHGLTGLDVREIYNSGKIKELAVYCADDVRATYELYKIWKSYLDL
ncbi:MAG: ribonuclease H-like domain-containing protein [Melioribacteraceae bacterium]|nr:ribonuclease H-like domain-containing protein [Melioribacteraceae bacterium]